MINRLLDMLFAERPDLRMEPDEYDFCLLLRANLNFTLYRKADRVPLLFFKVSNEGGLDRCYEHVSHAYRTTPTLLPEPIAYLRLQPYEVLVTRAQKMRLLTSLVRHGPMPVRLLERSVDQLLSLHQLTAAEPITFDLAYMESTFLVPARDLGRTWGLDKLADHVQTYLARLEPHVGTTIPSTKQHGDFNLSNIGVVETSDRILFLDWDLYAETTFPLFDITTLVDSLPRTASDLAERLAVRYCQPAQLDPALIRDFAPLVPVLHAKIKMQRNMVGGIEQSLRETQRSLEARV